MEDVPAADNGEIMNQPADDDVLSRDYDSESEDEGMRLCGIERAWALEVKEAVESDPDLEPLSDFDYAMNALVMRGDVNDALRRIQAMQAFRREYQIDNTPTQGVQALSNFVQYYEAGYFLDLEVGQVALDLSKKVPDVFRGREGINPWRTMVVHWYYCLRSVQPTLESIRAGIVWLFETDGFDWRNVDMNQERRLHDELYSYYPCIYRAVHVYNSGYVASLFMSLLKGFVAEETYQSVLMGCRLENNNISEEESNWWGPTLTLRDVYNRPYAETVQQMIGKHRDLLELRNQNERSFVL